MLPFFPSLNTSEYRWTGRSHIVDTSSHFARSWHHTSRSGGGLPVPVGVLEQQHPNWSNLIEPAINDALRIVTGCLRPTPVDNLPILTGIRPAELRLSGATLSLARRAMKVGHLLLSALTCPPSAKARGLVSRHAFVPAAQQLISISVNNNIRAAHCGSPMECGVGGQPACIPDTGTHPPGMALPRWA